jgi:hypothetical protein
MWRRWVHDIFGFFDESLVSSGDFEFWLRISQLCEFYHLRLPLGLYLERPCSVEHVNHDLKSKEDLKIQAHYLHAILQKRVVRCRLLEQLRQLLQSDSRSVSDQLTACFSVLEKFICPAVACRFRSAHADDATYPNFKYRILSGNVAPAQIGPIIDDLSRLLLGSKRWYRNLTSADSI